MIDPRELRIGNIVDTINRTSEVHLPNYFPLKVGSIEFFKVHLYTLDKPFVQQALHQTIDITDITGVELTPEWLERGGLPENGSTQNMIFDYGICLERRDNNLYIVNDFDSKKIDYVHQWQNIYFVLTGKELEFKL